ncbi:MAG: PilT/PilU family type 4a pilus ATPase [Planctomycetes bacterium]|nr:PilT/PilU family type 4a pilus ATPase [Planctomycetota bacterium]
MQGPVTIFGLMAAMKKYDASDLHIRAGLPPYYRIGGYLKEVNSAPLTGDETDHLLQPLFNERLQARFDENGDVDFAQWDNEGDRFRVNIFRAGGHMNAAIRRVKSDIPTYEVLHLPPIYEKLISQTHEGLVLVVGVTGCGKSTTLAAMIEHINETRSKNIITIEDPVEYHFESRQSIVAQREIGIDVIDYASALKYMVRQDPDVVFIGEMRDHGTVLAAIQAAETGHLVFGSMHTADTMQSFNRILEFFPQSEHGFVRHALANTLKGICAQRLLPAVEGFEVTRVPATEVLLSNAVVREKIREGEDEDLPAVINGSLEEGMHSYTWSLAGLVEKEWVTKHDAMIYAPNQSALDSALKGLQVKAQTLVSRVRSSG